LELIILFVGNIATDIARQYRTYRSGAPAVNAAVQLRQPVQSLCS